MPDTATVTEAPGSPYTWASAGFTWASASAGKSWATAYPAVYSVAVAVALALAETIGHQSIKRSGESLQFTENIKRQFTLRESEAVGFAETYSDLISYVLRWVETMTFAEKTSKADRKALQEIFQATDYLSRALLKQSAESVSLADSIRRLGTMRFVESVPLTEAARRGVTKTSAETFGASDDLDRAIAKRISEAIGFAETYTDLIAFVLRISEGLGFSDLGARQIKKPIAEALGATDQMVRHSIKQVAEAVAISEALGRTVAYRRYLTESFPVSDALRRAMRLTVSEALALAEQYRRHANGVISDMLIASTEINEDDFAAIIEAGHPPGFTDFRDFIQGDYTYRRALFRGILSARNSDRGFIDALRVTVDVPDIFDRGTAQINDAVAGAAITFSRSFRVPPEVTMTHKGGTAVAIPRLIGAVTTTGFSAVLENSIGTRVTGSFTWIAQGY
jgi:hypothetical protein